MPTASLRCELVFLERCFRTGTKEYPSLSLQGDYRAEYQAVEDITMIDYTTDFDVHYGLLAPQQTVIVRPYTDDGDDRVLQEIQPRFIVMFEPNLEFIRRLEVLF